MRKQQKKDLKYYDSLKPPLLMQGFDRQFTNVITPVVLDRKVFTTRVNRGIVNYLDYVTVTLAQVVNGLRELDYNATQISITAGGQEVLKNDPGERYDYAIDVGGKQEQKIPIILNGGQQIISKLELPDLVSNSGSSPAMVGQLIAHYTTRRHDEWVKKFAKFGQGLGLKRQSYRVSLPAGSSAEGSIIETIPKNQGEIIGFSFMFIGTDLDQVKVNFSVDNLGLIENIMGVRFSRLNQRDPFIIWSELNPGSIFKLALTPDNGYTTINLVQCWVTLYFNN